MLHHTDASSLRPENSKYEDSIRKGSASDAEFGIYLDKLRVGAVLEVETSHTVYQIENRGGGQVLISGHPEYCPTPVLVVLHGSVAGGGAILKSGFIGRGMGMEFLHPERGIICTSRVREIRQLSFA